MPEKAVYTYSDLYHIERVSDVKDESSVVGIPADNFVICDCTGTVIADYDGPGSYDGSGYASRSDAEFSLAIYSIRHRPTEDEIAFWKEFTGKNEEKAEIDTLANADEHEDEGDADDEADSADTDEQDTPAAAPDAPAYTDLTLHHVVMYCCGVCEVNREPGGWAVVLKCGASEKTIHGSMDNGYKSRITMISVISGLRTLNISNCIVDVYVEDKYLVQNMRSGKPWKWMEDDWAVKDNGGNFVSDVINKDLWEQLLSLCSVHRVAFCQLYECRDNERISAVKALAEQALDEGYRNLNGDKYVKFEPIGK